MKAKHQRAWFVALALVVMAVAASVLLSVFRENLVFFVTPAQLSEKLAAAEIGIGQTLRLGGLVEEDSVKNLADGGIGFTITDLQGTRAVLYHGIVPALFREGQGVVAEGALREDGVFVAKTLLAKHDENYMPPEVARALKASGQWKDYGTTPDGKSSPRPYMKEQAP